MKHLYYQTPVHIEAMTLIIPPAGKQFQARETEGKGSKRRGMGDVIDKIKQEGLKWKESSREEKCCFKPGFMPQTSPIKRLMECMLKLAPG